ncbi:unnamed protein product [Sphagnum compactum]
MLFFHHDNAQPAPVATHQMSPHNLIHQMAQGGGLNQMTVLNGAFDQGGWASQVAGGNSENAYAAALIGGIWWLTTTFLEGVTIALVYSHLTEGAGSGKISVAGRGGFRNRRGRHLQRRDDGHRRHRRIRTGLWCLLRIDSFERLYACCLLVGMPGGSDDCLIPLLESGSSTPAYMYGQLKQNRLWFTIAKMFARRLLWHMLLPRIFL